MKKNLLLRMAFAMLLFAGLSFFNSIQAQVSSTLIGGGGAAGQSTPTENFVAPPVAIERLEAALTSTKVTLESLQPGTPTYAQLEAKALLYNAVLDDIVGGKGVAQAIQDGILLISSDHFNLPKATVTQLRTELINLLRA